jgi:hypothetical protein
VNRMEEWTTAVLGALGLPASALQSDLVLDLARDVAHGVARPAAPLTAYLVGLAAGRDGAADPDVARALTERIAALARQWPGEPGGDAGQPRGQRPGSAPRGEP